MHKGADYSRFKPTVRDTSLWKPKRILPAPHTVEDSLEATAGVIENYSTAVGPTVNSTKLQSLAWHGAAQRMKAETLPRNIDFDIHSSVALGVDCVLQIAGKIHFQCLYFKICPIRLNRERVSNVAPSIKPSGNRTPETILNYAKVRFGSRFLSIYNIIFYHYISICLSVYQSELI